MSALASKRRWRWWLLGAAAIACVAAAWLFTNRTATRISSYHAAQIEPGMTRAQVEAILGGPPGDYRTPPLRLPDAQMLAHVPAGEQWQGDRLSVYVVFDAKDRVEGVTAFHPGPMRASWYRALQEWLPLPD